MQTPTVTNSAAFIDTLLADLPEDSVEWVGIARQTGAARARHLGIPNRKHEDWLYTDLRKLTKTTFAPPEVAMTTNLTAADLAPWTLPTASAELVFVNGVFAPELSHYNNTPEGITVLPLAMVVVSGRMDVDEVALQHAITRVAADKENVFTSLNRALWQDGAFIQSAPGAKTTPQAPVHILQLTDPRTSSVQSHPRNVVLASAHSSVQLIETFAALDGENSTSEYLVNTVNDLILGDGARVEWYTANQAAKGAFHFSDLRVQQAGGSHFHATRADVGGALIRNAIEVTLVGEEAEADLNGIYVLKDKQLVDNQIFINHRSPNAVSRQLYKGVLDGESRGSFAGKILVAPEAQQTNAYQTSRHLLLSEGAEANTRPMLEILADDVKCSHGATSGPVAAQELFYLESRGIPRPQATRLLARGFIYEVVYQLENEVARDCIDKTLTTACAD